MAIATSRELLLSLAINWLDSTADAKMRTTDSSAGTRESSGSLPNFLELPSLSSLRLFDSSISMRTASLLFVDKQTSRGLSVLETKSASAEFDITKSDAVILKAPTEPAIIRRLKIKIHHLLPPPAQVAQRERL